MGLTQITTGGVDDNINIDSNTLKVDGTNNRVGIGTSSPQTITHVLGANPIFRIQDNSTAIADAFAGIQLAESGSGESLGNYWQIALEGDSGTSTDHLTFKDGTGERMRIDSSGNVGIGTSSPSVELSIAGSDPQLILWEGSDGASSSKVQLGTGTVQGFINIHKGDGTRTVQISSDDTSYFNGGNVGIGTTSPAGALHVDAASGVDGPVFDSGGTGNTNHALLVRDSGNNQLFRVNNNGKVGIGTTSPDDELHINASSANVNLRLTRDTNTGVRISGTDGTSPAFIIDTISSGTATERARIDSSGRLNIGATSNAYTDARLQANTSEGSFFVTRHSHLLLQNKNASTTNWWNIAPRDNGELTIGNGAPDTNGIVSNKKIVIDSSGNVGINTSSPNGKLDVAFNSNTTVGLILSNAVAGTSARFYSGSSIVGSITVTGSATAFNTSSDYRLKENVVDIADGITRVKQLSPRRFNFIADDTTTVDGFIAHEAQTVVPEAVTGEKDGEEMQGIDQSKLVPLLTAALQEAIAKIETLETKVAALEAG